MCNVIDAYKAANVRMDNNNPLAEISKAEALELAELVEWVSNNAYTGDFEVVSQALDMALDKISGRYMTAEEIAGIFEEQGQAFKQNPTLVLMSAAVNIAGILEIVVVYMTHHNLEKMEPRQETPATAPAMASDTAEDTADAPAMTPAEISKAAGQRIIDREPLAADITAEESETLANHMEDVTNTISSAYDNLGKAENDPAAVQNFHAAAKRACAMMRETMDKIAGRYMTAEELETIMASSADNMEDMDPATVMACVLMEAAQRIQKILAGISFMIPLCMA